MERNEAVQQGAWQAAESDPRHAGGEPRHEPQAGGAGEPAPRPHPQGGRGAGPGEREWRGAWAHGQATFTDPQRKSPVVASILSLMPGLGQVYVGDYGRGFIHVATVASIIALLNSNPPDFVYPLFGIFLPFFWLYNVVDAGRRAILYNLAMERGQAPELPVLPERHGSVVGGVALVVIGTLFLMGTAFDVDMSWLEDWWPMAPILIGTYLVVRGIREGKGGSRT